MPLTCLSLRDLFVIAGPFLFIAGPVLVIAGLTRNPVAARHWIPDQSLPRARSGVRDDSLGVQDDNLEIAERVI